ncbi:MAG TPA: alpha/beta fold hydrolase [Methylomirabilota bacterium]|nr:alpha/beta fold hydrolase [Methylomirabilota bacterium]
MPSQHRLIVRETPVELLSDGTGPALLFLHGAGGAGRWLPFHAELARRFTVYLPKHPGHGGAPAAEWIEHISDLAFHYLDLLDELKLDRVHLVGSSLGGWIAAEMATMASHRLKSLALIAPVGIKVDGWIYPFLFAMELPQLVATVFHDQAKALALAPGDLTNIDTLAELYRERAALARVSWNPYLYNPLLRRRLGRITAPTLLCWGERDRVAPLLCAEAWAKEIPGAQLRTFAASGHLPHLEEPEAVAAAVADFCGPREVAR